MDTASLGKGVFQVNEFKYPNQIREESKALREYRTGSCAQDNPGLRTQNSTSPKPTVLNHTATDMDFTHFQGTYCWQERLHILIRVCYCSKVYQVRMQHLLIPIKTKQIPILKKSSYLLKYKQQYNYFQSLMKNVLPEYQQNFNFSYFLCKIIPNDTCYI